MKKEEPSIGLARGNPSSLEESTGSLSRPGRTVPAPIEKPALSLNRKFLKESVVAASSTETVLPMLLRIRA